MVKRSTGDDAPRPGSIVPRVPCPKSQPMAPAASASAPMSAIERARCFRLSVEAAIAASGSANAGLASASANCAALANRSAGNLANACVSAALTLAGTIGLRVATGTASSVTTLVNTACTVGPVCGGSPTSIS